MSSFLTYLHISRRHAMDLSTSRNGIRGDKYVSVYSVSITGALFDHTTMLPLRQTKRVSN